jgi:pantothenate kinase
MADESVSVDHAMRLTYEEVSREIMDLYQQKGQKQLLIAIAGPPGAGKSTFSSALHKLIPKSKVLPMDGYHYTKALLKAFPDPIEAFKRRGSHWTFDGEAFVKALQKLKSDGHGLFPSFDHGVGDPVENDITIGEEDEIVLIEGNYLLLDIAPWREIKEVVDFSYFIYCDVPIISDRVCLRHMSVGRTEAEAKERVDTNDALNAIEILGCRHRADKIINSV